MLQSFAECAGGVLSAGGVGAYRSAQAVRVPAQSSPAMGPRTALATDTASGNVGGMVMAAAILLLLGLAGVIVWRSDVSSALSADGATVDTSGSSGQSTDQPESTTGTEPMASGQAATAGETETKSDPEIIVEILEDHEGRMKQANIVDETGWSKSKVSMLLSDMEEEGDISKLRVGRENIISLSGNEPEAAGSPFDDE